MPRAGKPLIIGDVVPYASPKCEKGCGGRGFLSVVGPDGEKRGELPCSCAMNAFKRANLTAADRQGRLCWGIPDPSEEAAAAKSSLQPLGRAKNGEDRQKDRIDRLHALRDKLHAEIEDIDQKIEKSTEPQRATLSDIQNSREAMTEMLERRKQEDEDLFQRQEETGAQIRSLGKTLSDLERQREGIVNDISSITGTLVNNEKEKAAVEKSIAVERHRFRRQMLPLQNKLAQVEKRIGRASG